MAKQLCMHCYISGKVQGVWFRASTKRQAEALEITGWVRNLMDGRVEVFACGNEIQLNIFYSWLQHGPQHALVTEYSREDITWEEYVAFDIL